MSDNYCEHCGGRFTTQPGMIEKLCTCDIENLTEQKRGQMETQVSDDFGGRSIILKMNGDEIELLIYLLETFAKGSQKQILLNKLLKIKLEMVTKVSQNSR